MLYKLDKEDVFIVFDEYYKQIKKNGTGKLYQLDFFRRVVKKFGVSGAQHQYIKDYYKEWKQKVEG